MMQSPTTISKIQVIDSHTGGEPTRVVLSGGPDLGRGSMVDKLQIMRGQYDHYRAAIVNEPRGSDVLVGALLTEPLDRTCAAGVIFFNNVGYLGMCGHGTIGIVATLAHLGRIEPGQHRIETPVGTVTAQLHPSGEVAVQNVAAYRLSKDVSVHVAGYGIVRGDIAWGGNWFFLTHEYGQELTFARVEALTDFTRRVRDALEQAGITGHEGATIDHIELCGPASSTEVHSRNFVLCPGNAYDRSPCGTGTSARLACLFADGKIHEGEIWRQESICGSVFEGTVHVIQGKLIPTIKGRAFINAEATLLLDPEDPYCWGMEKQVIGDGL